MAKMIPSLVFLGIVAAASSAQLTSPISYGAHHPGYLGGGFGSAYPNVYNGYNGYSNNLGLNYQNPYYGGYSSANYGQVPYPSFNGALPLGYGAAHGQSYTGLAGYGGYAGYSGYGGFGVPASQYQYGGLGLRHGGLGLNNFGLNGGALPYNYGGLGVNGLVNSGYQQAPKAVLSSNELVIAHGGAGSSRQWLNRFDKN